MDLVQELNTAKQQRREAIQQVNGLTSQRQVLVYEVAKLEGKIKALELIIQDEKKEEDETVS